MLDTVLEALTAATIVIGSTFILIGSFGLIKLPDLLSRLHGPSKATTVGVGGCLIASMLHFGLSTAIYPCKNCLSHCSCLSPLRSQRTSSRKLICMSIKR